jgi:hypothetical protein
VCTALQTSSTGNTNPWPGAADHVASDPNSNLGPHRNSFAYSTSKLTLLTLSPDVLEVLDFAIYGVHAETTSQCFCLPSEIQRLVSSAAVPKTAVRLKFRDIHISWKNYKLLFRARPQRWARCYQLIHRGCLGLFKDYIGHSRATFPKVSLKDLPRYGMRLWKEMDKGS